jgi:hypothetical protein
MAEYSLFWDDEAGIGDVGPYDDADMCDEFFRMVFNSDGNRGVLKGWTSGLEVSHVAGTTVSVAAGGALVHGGWFESTEAHQLAGLSNNDYVVVRRTWAGSAGIAPQATRLAVVAALTQDATLATHYDIPLARVTVAGGVITVITDLREFCEFSTEWMEGFISTSDAIVDGSMSVDKFADQTRWITRAYGQLRADSSDPAQIQNLILGTWIYFHYTPPSWSPVSVYCWAPWRPVWYFMSSGRGVWATFRVPEDIATTGLYGTANISVYVWEKPSKVGSTTKCWSYSAWTGGDTDAFVVQSGTSGNYAHGGDDLECSTGDISSKYAQRKLIGTISVNHGDIVHFLLTSCTHSEDLYMLEFAYTADS